MAVESDDYTIDQLINRKKIQKLTKKETITVEIDKQTPQNTASSKTRCIKSIKLKAKVLLHMKIWYLDVFWILF